MVGVLQNTRNKQCIAYSCANTRYEGSVVGSNLIDVISTIVILLLCAMLRCVVLSKTRKDKFYLDTIIFILKKERLSWATAFHDEQHQECFNEKFLNVKKMPVDCSQTLYRGS